jgi:hypothetical protein
VAVLFGYDTKNELLQLQESVPSILLGWPVDRDVFRHHNFSTSIVSTPGVGFVEPAQSVPEDEVGTSKNSSQSTTR